MHADEAVLAFKLGDLLEGRGYRYDPRGYHGPLLIYLSALPARLRGAEGVGQLDETLLRSVPAMSGLLLVLAPLVLAPIIGWVQAAFALLLLAVSPVFVFYARYYIPETLLVLFNLGLLASVYAWLRWPGWPLALLAGVAAGLMLATKETAVLAFAAMAVSFGVCFRTELPRRPSWWLAFLAGCLGTAAAFLTSFGYHPGGLLDLLRSYHGTYIAKAFAGGPHRHGWHYYLGQLLGGGELALTEVSVLVLGGLGMWQAWRSRRPPLRSLVVFTLLLTAVYSVIPYKTPWCAMNFYLGWVLLAAIAAGKLLLHRHRTLRVAVPIGLAAITVQLGYAARLAAVGMPADPRNPWVYAHTTPDALELARRIDSLAPTLGERSRLRIQVIGTINYWPLPWYLRSFPKAEWWQSTPLTGTPPGDVLIFTPDAEAEVAEWAYSARPPGQRELYVPLIDHPVYLRPGVELRAYVLKGLAERSSRRHAGLPWSVGPK